MPRPAPERPRRSSLTPFYVILGLVLLAGIGVFLANRRGPGGGGGGNLVNKPATLAPLTNEQLQRVQGISRGRADAPITIYEFADFQCPHCAEFATLLEPVIMERLVDTGKARYVFYDFPLGFKWSWLSARAGRCANAQGKFWEFHSLIFARQQEWAFAKDPVDIWGPLAQQVGLDQGKFEACVRSDQFQKDVTESSMLGSSLGVGGTPTLFVNGRRIETPPTYAALETELRKIAPGAFEGTPAAAPAGVPAGPVAPAAPAATAPQ
ncbi:MAG TPA: DsbA family protein [Longimicrobium sp.]|nr:DsbA family protein [Longimicrobium sp.]